MARPTREGLYQDNKSNNWYCRFYSDGVLVRASTKTPDYNQALEVYSSLRLKSGAKPDACDAITVNTILNHYHHVRGQFLKGQSGYQKGVLSLLGFYDSVLFDLLSLRGSAFNISCFILKRSEGDGVKPATVNREIGILSAAANQAIEAGYEVVNPCVGKKLSVAKHQYHWLTVEQARRLILAAKDAAKCSEHLHDYLILAFGTGMRMSEMLKLEVCDIHLDKNEIWLRQTKSGEPHSIPMIDDVRNMIKGRLMWCDANKTSYLFCNLRTRRPIKTIIKPFKRACVNAGITISNKKEGIEGFRVHDTRHTFGSWLIQNGASIEEVADLLNHSDIRTTQIYAHHAPNARKGTLKKLPNI